MATFLRRKFAGMMKKDDTPLSLTIPRPEGAVVFTKKEQQRYTWLLTMLDSDADDQLAGAEGAMFLRRSQLNTDQLREVWRLASGGTSKAKLGRDDWLIACKLVAVVQHKGLEPSMSAITGVDPLPIADFHYDIEPDVAVEGLAEIPPESIRVRVANPTTYGAGLSKHTRYNVTTNTTLGHFPRKDMSVWRRFSDFEWLHRRLSTVYPAAMIPLFPAKRLVGNTDESFVAERQAALEAYLSRVAVHPALSQSVDLLVFLDATDAGLEAAKQLIEAVEREEADSLLTRASDMVSSIASRGGEEAKLVIKADETYVSGCSQHGAALARLSKIVKSGSLLEAAEHKLANTASGLGKALIALADHERRHASAGTSAAAAVAAAAAASKRAQDALFSGSLAGTGTVTSPAAGGGAVPLTSTGLDSAAAAAFASHTAAASVDSSGSISAMFAAADFNDPYSSLHSAAPGTSAVFGKMPVSGAAAGPVTLADSLPELLTAAGNCLVATAARKHEDLAALEAVWLRRVRAERETEAELAAAIARRDVVVDRVQDANAALQRKKKAMAGLKPTAPDFAAKSAEASANVERADRDLAACREQLDRVTEVLKFEMGRTSKGRRQHLVAHLAEYAKLQAAQARAEAEAWAALVPAISGDAGAVDASKEAVAAVARKAEARARSGAKDKAAALASAYGGASAPGSEAGAAAASAAGGMGVGVTDSAAMPVFADEAPMPASADDV